MKYITLALLLLLSGCKTTGGFPDPKDVAAVTEVKPVPGANILTDPAANDRYDNAIKGTGDRLRAEARAMQR
jgi:hypothetical protein